MRLRILLLMFLCLSGLAAPAFAAAPHAGETSDINFPRAVDSYHDGDVPGIVGKLVARAKAEPFNVIATLIFLCAIFHTFLATKINRYVHHLEEEHQEMLRNQEVLADTVHGKTPVSFKATILHFVGEVEAVFGIWAVILFGAILAYYGAAHVTHYVDTREFTEPIFVVVIMAIAATRPVIKFAEACTSRIAGLFGGGVTAWWVSILCFVPLLGSFITEPAAMTIAALLLGEKFFRFNPSLRFRYATLGLLFVAVSVGGTLTHFAAPPVLMVAATWNLTTAFMFEHIGWKAALSILISTAIYFAIFRREFAALKVAVDEDLKSHKTVDPDTPAWIVVVHLVFLGFTVFTLHHPPFVIAGFLFFLAFMAATEHHQYQIALRGPILVGFFLAGLIIHGGLQAWWIEPVLAGLGELPLFIGSTALTAFNDNAAITYLASLVPEFDPHHAAGAAATALQYAVLTGAVTGGGLTVIANAPNPAGQSILRKYFDGGISPAGLLAGALVPTIVAAVIFCVLAP